MPRYRLNKGEPAQAPWGMETFQPGRSRVVTTEEAALLKNNPAFTLVPEPAAGTPESTDPDAEQPTEAEPQAPTEPAPTEQTEAPQ